jgi:hypothetical protein
MLTGCQSPLFAQATSAKPDLSGSYAWLSFSHSFVAAMEEIRGQLATVMPRRGPPLKSQPDLTLVLASPAHRSLLHLPTLLPPSIAPGLLAATMPTKLGHFVSATAV